jgi:hypothetical protein
VVAGARLNVSLREAQVLEQLMATYQDVFAAKSGGYWCTDKVYHRTDTTNVWPIHQPTCRLPLAKQAVVNNMLENMRGKGVIEESDSP